MLKNKQGLVKQILKFFYINLAFQTYLRDLSFFECFAILPFDP